MLDDEKVSVESLELGLALGVLAQLGHDGADMGFEGVEGMEGETVHLDQPVTESRGPLTATWEAGAW